MRYTAPMATLVFDIETAGEEFEAMDATTREALTRWIEKTSAGEEEYAIKLADLKEGLGFSPYTGEIVALGIYDVEKKRGVVYFQDPTGKEREEAMEDITLKPASEKEMLAQFWEGARHYDTFVSFNGRAFDAPFMNIRSAVHRIRPSVDLLSNRYLPLQREVAHVDLLDQLTFYGAVWKGKPSLHLACRAFGIRSPKGDGMKGEDVTRLFREGRGKDIARYNAGDLYATRDLYEVWCTYLRR